MRRKSFAETLKELRINAGLSAKDVYERLGIKQARFSAWETGKAEPSADYFLMLCKMYGVNDIFEVFGYSDIEESQITLDDKEIILIEEFRKMDKSDQQLMLSLFKTITSKLITKTRMLPLYDLDDIANLNDSLATFEDLRGSDYCQYAIVQTDKIPLSTEFLVYISDNSMEPILSVGDIACFDTESQSEFFRGSSIDYEDDFNKDKIFLFSVNGLDEGTAFTFIRKAPDLFDVARFKPLNPKWEEVIIEPRASIEIAGSLVGKIERDNIEILGQSDNTTVTNLIQESEPTLIAAHGSEGMSEFELEKACKDADKLTKALEKQND